MNTDVRTKLHSIVDNMSHKLKLDLDNALLKLITISDEYEETNRIIMTLPCVRKLVEKNVDAIPHFEPPLNISAALMSLMDYQEEEENHDQDHEEEEEEEDIVISEPTFNEPIIAVMEEVLDEEAQEELSKSRVEIVITELEQLLEEAGEQEAVVDEEVVDFGTDEEEEVVEEGEAEPVVEEGEAEEEEVVEEGEAEEEEVVEEEMDEEEESESVFEVTIDGAMYYTTNTTNGDIYEADENGDPGDKVGEFVSGQPLFLNA
jgi:hypothetical protein